MKIEKCYKDGQDKDGQEWFGVTWEEARARLEQSYYDLGLVYEALKQGKIVETAFALYRRKETR